MISCCACRLLSVQPDFSLQKYEIEESISNSFYGQYHFVLYYPKYHCKLNYIEHFWYSVKQDSRFECKYSLNALRQYVPLVLASVSNKTYLFYFYRYQRKIDLYWEELSYGFLPLYSASKANKYKRRSLIVRWYIILGLIFGVKS